MGVVRDVTVDNLVTAVGNIDTSSLAQDSTLQDVVTAIGNISGGNDPVTNTTVNTLGKDTSLQSIAAAITGLGTALGSDKANISGDNIADPSTFRNNIGLTTSTTTLTNPVSQIYAQHITKKNDVVYLYIDINNLNTTTEVIIGTIPSGFRPLHRINYEALVIASSDASFKGYAHINIQTNGNISYKSLGSYTGSFTTINVVYPVN